MNGSWNPVLRELLRRELAERHRGSVLGVLWLMILPLAQLAVLAWVFGSLLPARADGGALPYAAFLALGLWPWLMFANALSRGSTALIDNAALIGKVALPVQRYIDSRVLSSLLLDALGLALVLIALPLCGVPLTWSGVLYLPLVLLPVALLALATARIAAVMQVFVRDIGPALTALLSLGFFLTPVVYGRDQLGATLAHALAFNPLSAPIETLRAGFSGAAVSWPGLLHAAVLAVFLWALAALLLKRARPHLEDFL